MRQANADRSQRHGGTSMLGPEMLTVVGVLIGGYVLMMVVGNLLSTYGPSGNHPYAWSYRGNGGLDAIIILPLTVLVAGCLVALWWRGYSFGVGVAAGFVAFVLGAIATVGNSVGIVGQLPDSSQARLTYGVIFALALAIVALAAGLGLVRRLARRARWGLADGLLIATAAVLAGIQAPLADQWSGTWFALLQIVLVALIPVSALLAAGPRRTSMSVHETDA